VSSSDIFQDSLKCHLLQIVVLQHVCVSVSTIKPPEFEFTLVSSSSSLARVEYFNGFTSLISVYSMAIFSSYVVIWSCTYTVPIYCLSISVYIYSVILYYLSNDGLASFEPSSHP